MGRESQHPALFLATKRHIRHKRHIKEDLLFFVPFVLYVPFCGRNLERRQEGAAGHYFPDGDKQIRGHPRFEDVAFGAALKRGADEI